jgi:hypothetical protein
VDSDKRDFVGMKATRTIWGQTNYRHQRCFFASRSFSSALSSIATARSFLTFAFSFNAPAS